jgi:hypothetical protein
MILAFGAVHIRLSDVAQVVDGESDPQARVKGESKETPPGPNDEQRMHAPTVRTE